MEIGEGPYRFAREADWYIDYVGIVEFGLDLRNKKVVLRRIYECTGCTERRLLRAAYRRLDEKVKGQAA